MQIRTCEDLILIYSQDTIIQRVMDVLSPVEYSRFKRAASETPGLASEFLAGSLFSGITVGEVDAEEQLTSAAIHESLSHTTITTAGVDIEEQLATAVTYESLCHSADTGDRSEISIIRTTDGIGVVGSAAVAYGSNSSTFSGVHPICDETADTLSAGIGNSCDAYHSIQILYISNRIDSLGDAALSIQLSSGSTSHICEIQVILGRSEHHRGGRYGSHQDYNIARSALGINKFIADAADANSTSTDCSIAAGAASAEACPLDEELLLTGTPASVVVQLMGFQELTEHAMVETFAAAFKALDEEVQAEAGCEWTGVHTALADILYRQVSAALDDMSASMLRSEFRPQCIRELVKRQQEGEESDRRDLREARHSPFHKFQYEMLMEELQRRVAASRPPGRPEKPMQRTGDRAQLYRDAIAVAPKFRQVLEHVRDIVNQMMRAKYGARYDEGGVHGVEVLCGIKGYMRVCEKTVLDYRGDMSLLRDLVRGMLVCPTLEEMELAMRVLAALADLAGETGFREFNEHDFAVYRKEQMGREQEQEHQARMRSEMRGQEPVAPMRVSGPSDAGGAGGAYAAAGAFTGASASITASVGVAPGSTVAAGVGVAPGSTVAAVAAGAAGATGSGAVVASETRSSTPSQRIHTCIQTLQSYRPPAGDGGAALHLLLTFVKNVADSPSDQRYRSINLESASFKSKLAPLVGPLVLLRTLGFVKDAAAPKLKLEGDVDLALFTETVQKLAAAEEEYRSTSA